MTAGPILRRISGLLLAPWWLVVAAFATRGTAAIFVAAALAAWSVVRTRRLAWHPLKPDPALLAFAAWAVLSCAWSITLPQSALVAGRLVLLLVGGAVYLGALDALGPAYRRTLWRIGAGAWGIALALLILDGLGHQALFHALGADSLAERLFLTKNGGIIVTMAAFPILPVLARSWRGRVLAAAGVAAVVMVDLLANSSSAVMSLALGLSVWALALGKPGTVRVVLAVALAAAVLAMPFLQPLTTPEAVVRAVPHFPPSFFHRLVIWDFVADRIAERPWLGWGVDTARAIPGGTDDFNIWFHVPWSDALYGLKMQYLPLHPHNMALEVWLNLGAVGAVLLAAALGRTVFRWLGPAHAGRPDADALLAGARTGWVAAAASIAFVSFGMWQMWWLALLGLCLGLFRAVEPPAAASR